MNFTSLLNADDPALDYVVTHVMFPVQVPYRSDCTIENDLALARAVRTAAHAYSTHIDDSLKPQCHSIVKMLDNLQASVQFKHLDKDNIISQLGSMQSGGMLSGSPSVSFSTFSDILAFLVRRQDAAVIFRRLENCTLYEPLEVSASHDSVKNTGGRLVYSYGGMAVGVPNTAFDDEHFQTELADFLSPPVEDHLGPPRVLANGPERITALLAGILRSVGHVVEGPRILKHVRDEVGIPDPDYRGFRGEWRRSSLWLLIRVAIQTSLARSPLGRASFKAFMLSFICNLAMDAHSARSSDDLLYLMSAKILRRLSKLDPSAPGWLSDMALRTCTRLQDTLNDRATEIQATNSSSPHWNPSELDLAGDIRHSLSQYSEYIRNTPANPGHVSLVTPFFPKDYHRGTLADYLSSDVTIFYEAYSVDPFVALYDVEQSVEHGIDDWLAQVTNVEEACTQLGTLVDMYLCHAAAAYRGAPEYYSVMALTVFELWVVLDKLIVEEIPMFSEYSPGFLVPLLEFLHLREMTNLHRISRVHRYLVARHSRSRAGLPALSDDFTEDSFPIRYCDSSPDMVHLTGRIEAEATLWGRESRLGERGTAPPLLAKVLVFGLLCPTSFRVWLSVTPHLLSCIPEADNRNPFDPRWQEYDLLFGLPGLEPLLDAYPDLPGLEPLLDAYPHQKSHDALQLAYFHTEWHSNPRRRGFGYVLPRDEEAPHFPSMRRLCRYKHAPNHVLSSQAGCSSDSSLDEFISFEHLRGARSLRWIDILRELRARTLNFRSYRVCSLLAELTCRTGPFNVKTGEWEWHQELQDPAFCNKLLNELESLFTDVSNALVDPVLMRTVSLLLTRLLEASPPEGVSMRAFQLLRNVRRRTLEWVRELAYNLMQAPTNQERRSHLRDMAITCQSTFGVSPSLLCKVLHSAEDIEAVLSSAFFIHATSDIDDNNNGDSDSSDNGNNNNDDNDNVTSSFVYEYWGLSHEHRRRFSVAIGGVLRDVILSDVSDRGIDLAVCNIWPGYQTGPARWKPEQYPHSHWLVSTTAAAANAHSQTVHINLLDGSLLVDGRPLGMLPQEIRWHPLYQRIFDCVCTCQCLRHRQDTDFPLQQAPLIIPSNLAGMEFATIAMISDHFVSAPDVWNMGKNVYSGTGSLFAQRS